jgi:DNA polymerase-1
MAYRAFYSYLEPLKNSQGRVTTVCYGVAQSLNTLVREFGPDAMIAVNDHSGPTFRHEMYPLYKSNRTHNAEFHEQVPDLMRLLDAYGVQVFSLDGLEADDVIGALAKKYSAEGHEVFVVSNDKDFMQLVNSNVKIIAPKKGGTYKILDETSVMEKFGCRPDQVIDCLALMGDSVDCVPGVKGIGPKTATALIKSGGDLDGIYSLLGTYKPGVAKKLAEHRDMAYLSKQLVSLKTDLGLDHPIEEFVIDKDPLEREAVKTLFEEFEFKSLVGGTPTEDLIIKIEE